MVITVTGGSSTGKSAIAEDIAMRLNPGTKLYIATMVRASEAEDPIIARHRKLREGKNFVTLECPVSPDKQDIKPQTTALLECVANLLTNEMFGTGGSMSDGLEMSNDANGDEEPTMMSDACRNDSSMMSDDAFVNKGSGMNTVAKASDRVIASIKELANKCENLIIVTNEVFSDGIIYDDMVMEYIKELGTVNRALMEISDIYMESVYGIPYFYKVCPDIPDVLRDIIHR